MRVILPLPEEPLEEEVAEGAEEGSDDLEEEVAIVFGDG